VDRSEIPGHLNRTELNCSRDIYCYWM